MQYLLDTNIVIYLMENHDAYSNFFENEIGDSTLCISVVTFMEILIGIDKKDWIEYEKYLRERYTILDINSEISLLTVSSIQESYNSLRKISFMDYVIGGTATFYKLPLITNNPKDFKMFKNLEIITL